MASNPPPRNGYRPFPAASGYNTPAWLQWRTWESVAINLCRVPREANTFTLWKAFRKEGSITSIDIFDDAHGQRDTRGRIRFRPPPATDFWRRGPYRVKLRSGRVIAIPIALDLKLHDSLVPSPARSGVVFPAEMANETRGCFSLKKLQIPNLSIGVPLSGSTIHWMRSAQDLTRPNLIVDLKRRAFFITFNTCPLVNQHTQYAGSSAPRDHPQFRLKIPFLQLTRIFELCDPISQQVSFLTILDSPPTYHRLAGNVHASFHSDSTWREADMWFRQTLVFHNATEQLNLPTNLRVAGQIIDIGRWNAFKLTFSSEMNEKGNIKLLREIMKDHNIPVVDGSHFIDVPELPVPVWRWIDFVESQLTGASSSGLQDLADQDYVHVPFAVRYQLEVCLSHGYLSEFTMSRAFVMKLMELGESKARRLLEHIANKKTTYLDPMDIFDILGVNGVSDSKIPAYCCFMRTARVTPSTIYYNSPTVDISNRVVRRYLEHADRFLRVRFTDEKTEGRINSTLSDTNDEVFTRVKKTLANGITIGDRHYEFLAFGNSQFREHGAYFFAALPNLSAAHIRVWMGQFQHIRNVAKHAARLGQCFSTTRAIAGCPVTIRKRPDIVRNGYTFSDGVGKISKFLAQMAMSELKIKPVTGEPPSAFQFRLGGCKGMLVVSSDPQPPEIHIRPSQYKFDADHGGLEIIRWSQFSIATLNRQLILVLSALRIPDHIFHSKLASMLQSFNEAMGDDVQATYLLQKYVDPNQMTLKLAQMVFDGFRQSKEPFMTSILALWKAWHLKHLKEKAKIVLDQGANLLGCLDETGTLKGYFDRSLPGKGASLEEKMAALPEIFVQICRLENNGVPEIIEGLCILARNPSLHPGDIRVVRAVNRPELRHLHDVIVLPQTGHRDVASMCSGGDLDGDDYLVVWDPDLIPRDWFVQPMRYSNQKPPDNDHDVTVDEITTFFVTYMKNDCLPRIAHAHMAWADSLQDGIKEEKCIRLARLHSHAVDYNKTGKVAVMTRDLNPRLWPHFMEKKHKRKEQIYHSKKILGQLYDAVETIDFVPSLEMPFDVRILECELKPPSEPFMEYARQLKEGYDEAMRRIMAQYEITTEFEVWSTFVLKHGNICRDYKLHEDLGRVASTLRGGFRQQCCDKMKGRTFDSLSPLVVAMYRITHEEMTSYLEARRREQHLGDDDDSSPGSEASVTPLPLISFPWIFSDILGQIAMGQFEMPKISVEGSPPTTSKKELATFTHTEVREMLAGFGQSSSEPSVNEVSLTPIFTEESVGELKIDWDQEKNADGDEKVVEIVEVESPPTLGRLANLVHDYSNSVGEEKESKGKVA
ncbi:RNA-directed RNA polymerase (Sad-1) [Penicillium alfredii]|uniref:RNA-dependent RNA polymerase n=1 Tax=Penicillium alfredii TaxID=1506179 RepID=A0A9W9KQR2_9EURO|nr:RNA-directed RNA polymerase (Sad-1) [Penicillium alfredii]KAJ5114750.1 RNA-directed RNA polymerase (Sad-1) [Penicillium alfredii]